MNTKEMKVYINVLDELLDKESIDFYLDDGRDGYSSYIKAKLKVHKESNVIRLLAVPE